MKRAAALVTIMLAASAAFAAGPTNPSDRYDYNMRATNKGTSPPDAARNQGKFDPYTQGANTSTAAGLTDEGASAPAAKKSGKSHKKSSKKGASAPAAPASAPQ